MRKLVLVFGMLAMTLMASMGVLAEGEIVVDEVIAEPNLWIEAFKSWASLKNGIISIFGVSGLISLWKLRGVLKFFKSKAGTETIENMFVKVIAKVSDKPDLVLKIVKLVATMPVIENILNKAEAKAGIYELELQGKILDMEAKLSAKVFEDNKIPEAVEYLTKLRDEYENISTD